MSSNESDLEDFEDAYIVRGKLMEEVKDLLESVGPQIDGLSNRLGELNTLTKRRVRGIYWVIGVVVASLLALGGLGIWVYSIGRNTDDQFTAYRAQAVQNCTVRNQQASGTRSFITVLETLIPHDGNPSNAALIRALDGFLTTIPPNLDCAKLANP